MNKKDAQKRYQSIKVEMELYFGSDEPKWLELLEKAWITNLVRDESERNGPFKAVSDCPHDLQLRTAISAIEAGISIIKRGQINDGVDCIAEAVAMIQNVEARIR